MNQSRTAIIVTGQESFCIRRQLPAREEGRSVVDGRAVTADDRTAAEFGRLDILVNNAGMFTVAPFEDTPPADIDLIWNVSVRAVIIASLSPSTISFLRIAQTVAVNRMALSYQLICGEFVGVMVSLAVVESADSKD